VLATGKYWTCPEWREDKEHLGCFVPRRKGLWSFGDLETATWSEAEAVGGLSYSTQSFQPFQPSTLGTAK
jgi:hypothetical protein